MSLRKSLVYSKRVYVTYARLRTTAIGTTTMQRIFKSDIAPLNKPTLDEDPSWEADILKFERNLDRLKKRGIELEDLPIHKTEEFLNTLPHVAFRNNNQWEKDDTLLDNSSKLILGHTVSKDSDGKAYSNVDRTNIDPEFAREDVQAILKRIHYRCDMEKVYKAATTKRKRMPRIKYFTDEQLQKEREKFKEKLLEKIRMPLVMKARNPCDCVLAHDEVLDGYEESNVGFIDISEDTEERERFIVIREPSGILRKANWDERDRLTQVYFPVKDRLIVPPSLFKEANLKVAFSQNLHLNVLDQCMVQFQPDSSEYIRVFAAVYCDIDEKKIYNILRSTRYFGGLVFFLVRTKSVDSLLLYMINNSDKMIDAVDVLRLYGLMHPDSRTSAAIEPLSDSDAVAIIQAYIDNDSRDKKTLSLALESYSLNEKPPIEVGDSTERS